MSVALEKTIGKHRYSIQRMDVFEQMNVAADMRDIIIGLAMLKEEHANLIKKAAEEKPDAKPKTKPLSNEEYQRAQVQVLSTRGGLTKETRLQVMCSCLTKVTRHDTVGWAPILAAPGQMQYADIDLTQMYTLVLLVLEHNRLIDFFAVSPSDLDGQSEEENESGQPSRMARTGS